MLPTFLQPPAHTSRVSTGLLILRVILGLAFIQYGLTKVGHPTSWADSLALGLPSFIQPLTPLAELGGGILLVFGLLTPIAAIGIAIDMIFAVVLFIVPHGGTVWISPTPRLTFEKNIFYEAGALALLFCGPGAFSIDALLARNARDAALLPSHR
jgi:putative oxidoreductase